MDSLEKVLAGARVDAAVFALRPDYRALLVAVDGIVAGPSDEEPPAAAGHAPSDLPGQASHEAAGAVARTGSRELPLLAAAEAAARDALRDRPVEQVPHVAAWREAYRGFGTKPQRNRNSLEALMRRAGDGLPRVNRLTDIYNAISVIHQIPLGGEDLTRYAGAPRLIRATGEESFDTVAGGEPVIEHPEPGEVVWCDDAGVTCRRWNWRQARRTALTEGTTTALFILDALEPLTDEALIAAADDLTAHLSRLGPHVRTARRLITEGPME